MRIGIDLGGTKIEGILLDATGQELRRRRVATPRGDYRATVQTIVELVAWLEQPLSAGGGVEARAPVGVGIPGTISPQTGLVKNANSTWLIGQPFDRDLAAALGRPVRLQNDANCLAVSEATDGAGAGCAVVFAAILGTGCGAGIVVNGQVLTGANAIAGEWGHNPLPWPQPGHRNNGNSNDDGGGGGNDHDERPGPACYCGQHGCLETFVSGPGLAADYQRRTGRSLTADEVVRRAEAGEAAAGATLERTEDRLARGLAMVVNILDPNVIVLGGGLSNVRRLYQNLPARLARWCFSDGIATPIRPACHGDSSGVRGAAWLWRPDEDATTTTRT